MLNSKSEKITSKSDRLFSLVGTPRALLVLLQLLAKVTRRKAKRYETLLNLSTSKSISSCQRLAAILTSTVSRKLTVDSYVATVIFVCGETLIVQIPLDFWPGKIRETQIRIK